MFGKTHFFSWKKKTNQNSPKGCLSNMPLNQEKQTKQGIKDSPSFDPVGLTRKQTKTD